MKTDTKWVTKPKQVYFERYNSGVAAAWFTDFDKPQSMAFCDNIIRRFKEDDNFRKANRVFGVFNKRHPDIPSNSILSSIGQNDKTYPFKVFLRLYNLPEENTHESGMEWVNTLKETAQEISHTSDKYPNKFEVLGDVTTTPLKPISHLLLNDDVMDIIKATFPSDTCQELAIDSVAQEFFCMLRGAKDYILHLCTRRTHHIHQMYLLPVHPFTTTILDILPLGTTFHDFTTYHGITSSIVTSTLPHNSLLSVVPITYNVFLHTRIHP